GGNFTTVGLGALAFKPATANAALTLNVAAQAGKKLNFTGATVNGTGNVTFNDSADVGFVSSYATNPFTPGVVNLPGITVFKQGAGQLFLDNTGATGNTFTSSTIDIQTGRVVAVGSSLGGATNPLGSGVVAIDGGTLSLDTAVGNVSFDNAVTVSAS